MLSLQAVIPHTLELLRRLMAEPMLSETRLVGGTALALQYGHRHSVDLDFFGILDEDIHALRKHIEQIGSVVIRKETERIRIYELDGVKIDFVDYSFYPWLTRKRKS